MDLSESNNRKRHRNVTEDEISEFTPLSKRINNLHINPFFSFAKPFQQITCDKPEIHRVLVSEKLGELECGSSRSIDSGPEPNGTLGWGPQCYSPDLSPAENPFYYESNRMLYELYMERSRRSNIPTPSTSSHF